MTTPESHWRDLTTDEALYLVAEGSTSLMLVEGDVLPETFESVFKVCYPKPVKVGVYNASEVVVETVNHLHTTLRVGPHLQDVQPHIAVMMSDRLIFLGEQIKTSTRKQAVLNETYNILMPFDGTSLSSSVAKATPPRRKMIEWFIGGGERPPSAINFARLRTNPRARGVTVFVAGLATGVALLQPGVGFVDALALSALIGSIALHHNLKTLRMKFGEDYA